MDSGNQQIDRLLDRPVAYHRVFVDIAGSIHGAVMLSQALFWHHRVPAGRDGWWWKTYEEWDAETGLSRRLVDSARKALVAVGVMQFRSAGFPRRCWYRVDARALNAVLEQILAAEPPVADAPSLFDAPDCGADSLADAPSCADGEACKPDTADNETVVTPCFDGVSEHLNDESQASTEPSLADCANCDPSSLADPPSSLASRATQFVQGRQTDLTEITTEITTTPPPPTRVRARPAATEDPEHAEPADPDTQPPDQHPPWLHRDLEQRSQGIAAARAELGSGLANGAAFAMHADWRPGPSFGDRCAMAGVPGEYTADQLGEFVSYWLGEGSIARQGQWEHKFLTRLRRTAADSASTGDPHASRRSTRAADIDPYDDSWLTEDTIAYVESGREIGERLRAGQPVVRRDDDGVYRLATGDDR